MRDAVKIRIVNDCVTPYGPRKAGDELEMGRRRAAPLIIGGDADLVEEDEAVETATTPKRETATTPRGKPAKAD